MTTVLAVGVGVAAAAFFVRHSLDAFAVFNRLMPLRRGALAWWHFENIEVEQRVLVHWERLSTKGVSSPG